MNTVVSCTQDGVFKRPRIDTNGYTQVSLDVIDDENLSMGALGLYAVIECYYQSGEDLNKINFAECSSDSIEEFNAYWKELKDNGYLQKFPIDNI